MNQELIINPVSNKINLNDLLWNKGSDFIIYRYEKPIDRIEKLNENKEVIEINDYSLQLEASINSKYDTNLKSKIKSKLDKIINDEVFQEIGLKTWLGGGEVKVNKNTFYWNLENEFR